MSFNLTAANRDLMRYEKKFLEGEGYNIHFESSYYMDRVLEKYKCKSIKSFKALIKAETTRRNIPVDLSTLPKPYVTALLKALAFQKILSKDGWARFHRNTLDVEGYNQIESLLGKGIIKEFKSQYPNFLWNGAEVTYDLHSMYVYIKTYCNVDLLGRTDRHDFFYFEVELDEYRLNALLEVLGKMSWGTASREDERRQEELRQRRIRRIQMEQFKEAHDSIKGGLK